MLVCHWSMERSNMALPSSQSARSESRARISVLGLPPQNEESKASRCSDVPGWRWHSTSLSDCNLLFLFLTAVGGCIA